MKESRRLFSRNYAPHDSKGHRIARAPRQPLHPILIVAGLGIAGMVDVLEAAIDEALGR